MQEIQSGNIHVSKRYIDVMSNLQKDANSFNISIHKIKGITNYNNDSSIPFWIKLANYIIINAKYNNQFYYSNEYLSAKINRNDDEFLLYSKTTKAIKRVCKEIGIKRSRLIKLLELNANISSERCSNELKFIFENYASYKELMKTINSEIPNTKRAMKKLEDMSIIIRAQFTNENRNGSRRKVIINKMSTKFIFSDFNVHSTSSKLKKRYSGYLKSTSLKHGLNYLRKNKINTSSDELKEIENLELKVKTEYLQKLGITNELYNEFTKIIEHKKEQLIRALRKIKRYRIVSITNSEIHANKNYTIFSKEDNTHEELFKANEIKNYLNFQHHQSRTNKHISYYYKNIRE